MNHVRNDIRNLAIIAHVDHGKTTLVDALLPQSRFVLKKAFQHELRPIVVINKIDRQDARADAVLNEVFDLFVELGADDETLDFPVLYASGRAGTASWKLEEPGTNIIPVFEALLRHIPAPHGDPEKSLQIQITNILYNDYVGRIGVGRI